MITRLHHLLIFLLNLRVALVHRESVLELTGWYRPIVVELAFAVGLDFHGLFVSSALSVSFDE